MIKNSLEIQSFLHCGSCLKEIPEGVSPAEFADVSVGWTKQGIQVWCNRHDCNIMHMDFQGQKHPANTTRKSAKTKLMFKP